MLANFASVAVNERESVSNEKIASTMKFGKNLMVECSPLSDEMEVEKEESVAWYYKTFFFFGTIILSAVQFFLVLILLPFAKEGGKDEAEKIKRLLKKARGPSIFFGALHWTLNEVHNGITTARALHAIYGAPVLLRSWKGFCGWFLRLWFGFPPAAGLRNRLRWVHSSIFAELATLAVRGKDEIRLVSIACGSAVAMIEATSKFVKLFPQVKVEINLVDLNKAALRHASELAIARGLKVGNSVDDQVKIIETDLKTFIQTNHGFDIVEFVGFMDYREVNSVKELINSVVNMTVKGGVVFTTLIRKSCWRPVIRWIVGWVKLIYRDPTTIKEIISHNNCHASVETEATKQHMLITLRRIF
ncbi:MAG TPA: hypothetical protein PK831_03540 [Candidatus Magasanikbacteria bacterium]|jgi:hypothetical protein|nr:hypothetical protein [Candidatus Magasanikbacteria bacterium]HQF57542.1 hypothetical protein [Candidatus Magasanikbacteria bacterium]HQL52960.1 hypothetical protein [Candidatus Magasanikbacteria bacterium]